MAENTEVIGRLISAFHILHKHGILRESGSLSLRNPQNPATFLTSDRPAILVKSQSDLSEYQVDDSRVRRTGDQSFGSPKASVQTQHFLHSCVYAQYPGVDCIVLSNSTESIVYGLCNAGGSMLLPASTGAGFINHYSPIFDPAQFYADHPAPPAHELLVNDQHLGRAFALTLGSTAAEIDGEKGLPKFGVALIRGQGAVCWAKSLEEAVYRAIHMERNCEIQRKAMLLRENTELSVTYLNEEEARDCAAYATEHLVRRSWEAWRAEVERMVEYQHEVPTQS